MKTIYRIFAAVTLLLIACNGFSQTKLDRSQPPKPKAAPKIQIGDYKQATLDNGLKLIVVENHKLPRVSYSIDIDNDPLMEGAKAGYVNIAGEILGSGTTTKSKAQLDESVDFIGASFSTNASGMFGSCLKKHADQLLDIMSDVLLHPNFAQEELDKVRKQSISGLASEQTDPNALSGKITSVMTYGKNHPYGEFQTEESLNAITRDDLLNYYNTNFIANNAYLVVVGDITLDEAKAQAQKYFGSWKKGEIKKSNYTMPSAPAGNRMVFVPLAGAVQSVIDVTYPIDLKPGTQDAITTSVLNSVLGGNGFQGRLMQNLREDKAYTYGAYSSIASDELVGNFSAGASVRNEVTDSSITEILFEMKRLINEPVADSTLQTVKNILTGNFARSLERPQTIANFALNIEKYKLPKDYYATYLEKLNAVTKSDLQAAARKYLKPDNAFVTVVGNKEIAEKLSVFAKSGKVEIVNADGSELKELKPVPTGMDANKVLANYIAAIGGEKKLSKIKSFEQKGEMIMGPMTLDVSIKMKNKTQTNMTVNMQGMEAMKQIFDGTKGMIYQMGQPQAMTANEMLEAKMQADLLAEIHLANYGIVTELKGIDMLDGAECYVVEMKKPDGGLQTEYYNVSTGLKAKAISVRENDGKTVTTESVIKKYLTTTKGVLFASEVLQIMGLQQVEMKIKEVNLKPKFGADDFKITN